jgi:hypothetical protein
MLHIPIKQVGKKGADTNARSGIRISARKVDFSKTEQIDSFNVTNDFLKFPMLCFSTINE